MAKNTKKEEVIKKITTQRNFSYEMEGITLNFGLTIDNEENLDKFRKILLVALEDVEKTILDQNDK